MIRTMYEAFPTERYFREASEISHDIFLRHTTHDPLGGVLRLRRAVQG